MVRESQRRVVGMLGKRPFHIHGIDGAEIVVNPLDVARRVGRLLGRQVLAAPFVHGTPHRGKRRGDRVQIGVFHRREVRLLGIAALRNAILFQTESEGQRKVPLSSSPMMFSMRPSSEPRIRSKTTRCSGSNVTFSRSGTALSMISRTSQPSPSSTTSHFFISGT